MKKLIALLIVTSLSLSACVSPPKTPLAISTTGNVQDLTLDPQFSGMARDYPALTKRMLKVVNHLESELKEEKASK